MIADDHKKTQQSEVDYSHRQQWMLWICQWRVLLLDDNNDEVLVISFLMTARNDQIQ